jgi:hypothetical protein
MNTVFLLSPAYTGGRRAQLLLREAAAFPLALQLRGPGGAPLGDVFSFMSGLYFRGKLAYARAFARPPAGVAGALVIAPGQGLIGPEMAVDPAFLLSLSAVPVDLEDERYRVPLARDALALAEATGEQCQVVLLGSIASGKYVDVLAGVFGERLVFPIEFVGRGDMSRGGLMLRAADAGQELEYVPVVTAVRRGTRPPRLPPRRPRPTPPR